MISTYTPHKYLLSNCHIFGDTTYVLEPKLQNSDVNIHKKYNPRNSKMEFIGFRYMHSTKTTLVLNSENQEHLPIDLDGVS